MGSPRGRRFRGPAGSRRAARPPRASTRSASPRRPVPRALSAPPTPSSATSTTAGRRVRCTRTRTALALGVLGDVGQRLRDDVVGGGLDAVRKPLGQADVELERQPRAVGELLERGAQAALGEDAGVDALGELAQLAQRVGERRARLVEQRTGGGRVAVEPRVGEPERHRDRHQPLLRAVVQVALDPPPLGLRGLDDPRARRAQLLEPGAQLGLQALVLEREPGRRAGRGDELGLVGQRRVVDERRDPPALAPDLRHGPLGAVRQRRPSARRRRRSARRPPASTRRSATGRAARAPARRAALPGATCPPSSTTRSATAPRASRVRSRPTRNATGTAASASCTRDVGPVVQRLVERVVERPRDDQGERDRAGDEDGRDRQAPAGRGVAPAPGRPPRSSRPRAARTSTCCTRTIASDAAGASATCITLSGQSQPRASP